MPQSQHTIAAGPLAGALFAVLLASATPLEVASDDALRRLWSGEQLEGSPDDRRVTRLKRPDRQPPQCPSPRSLLPPLAEERRGSIRRVQPFDGRKIVALTFDLCERADDVAGYDRDVVNVLRAHGAAATFFAGGKWMRSHPDKTMQLMADPLFELGNHAWTHGNFRVIDAAKAFREIDWPQAQYELLREELAERAAAQGVPTETIGRIPDVPRLFRFPYGTCSPQALDRVAVRGLAAIQWDVVSGDPDRSISARALARQVVNGVRPGSIVVLHANGRGWKTAEALPIILETLAGRGYAFVTVSQLLDQGTPIVADDCYETRPGDNRRYDRLFGEGTG
jgi:peptidoglycan/xylan/chitin deacetylase (PgdA/CDA1 family)